MVLDYGMIKLSRTSKGANKVLEEKKMQRINELARKKKSQGLSEKESAEQKSLREEYLKSFRKSFRNQLENIEWTD